MSVEVVVLGCGVIGLSVAHVLAEAPDAPRVRVVADRAPENTLSRVAGAVFYPYAARHPRVLPWLEEGLARFSALAEQPDSGVVLRPGLELFRAKVGESPFAKLLPAYTHGPVPRAAPPPAPEFVDAYAFLTPCIEMPLYLRWLAARVRALGVAVELRRVDDLDELCGRDRVVIDCAGVRARALANDPRLQPTLGQLVRVERGAIDAFRLDEMAEGKPAYVVPRSQDVVLGSVDLPWDVEAHGYEPPPPDPARTEDIRERCGRLDPRVGSARVLDAYCGLRPARDEVRVEVDAERLRRGLRLVHCYGHGGAGVTLSWGSAREAAALARRLAGVPSP